MKRTGWCYDVTWRAGGVVKIYHLHQHVRLRPAGMLILKRRSRRYQSVECMAGRAESLLAVMGGRRRNAVSAWPDQAGKRYRR